MIKTAACLIFGSMVFYARTLGHGLGPDDQVIAKETKPVGGPWKVFIEFWRLLTGKALYIAVEAHLLVLLIHALNTALVYVVFGKDDAALLTAVLFCVLPAIHQGTCWISGKPYSIATTCVLLMFAFPLLSPVFYTGAWFFAQNAIVSPLPFLFTDYFFFAAMTYMVRVRAKEVIAIKDGPEQTAEQMVVAPRKAILYFKSLGYYTIMCITAHEIPFYNDYLFGIGLTKEYNRQSYARDWYFYIGIYVFMGLVAALILGNDKVQFSALWYLANISMWCNIVSPADKIASRYCYLAAIGLMNLIVNLIGSWAWLLVPAYAMRTWHAIPMYREGYWLMTHSMVEQANNVRAWIRMGATRFKANDFVGAHMDFMEALDHQPKDFKCLFNVAATFMLSGDIDTAESYYNSAFENRYETQEYEFQAGLVRDAKLVIDNARKTGGFNSSEIRIVK